MEKFIEIMAYVGLVHTVIFVILLVYGVIQWIRGVFPAVYRLGNGLSKRKVAIFAKGDSGSSLEQLLIDSKLFKKKNVFRISKAKDIGKAEEASVFLLWWKDWADDIDIVLGKKSDSIPLIVYAPFGEPNIGDENMVKLDGHRNTSVNRFRARLLNDVVTAMITTSYAKK